MSCVRCEHPNPQFERNDWECLNGIWEFEIDKSASGRERRLFEKKKFDGTILVPFCPESKLSGVEDTDFLNSVWYKRTFNVRNKEKRIVLHVGACDYLTAVYVNGKYVGEHCGGYTSFSFDVTDYVSIGENIIVIHALDDDRGGKQPRGKQSSAYNSYGCFYTRTTGIWQTVWIEYVPEVHIKSAKYYPDAANGRIIIKAVTNGNSDLNATAYYDGRNVGSATVSVNCATVDLVINLSETHLWEVGCGRLYDLELSYGDDTVKSYFGLRNVCIDGYKFLLNGKSVFQRTVLDQGYYPDGIYTAPDDRSMINDIEIAMAAGFNGARLHQKVFEPRFLYHCDKHGYMVWGEYANWGFDHTDIRLLPLFLKEWIEAVERDFNHPSVIGWCPFNETWDIGIKRQENDIIETVYKVTKLIDTTRPCIDTSGNFHVVTDIFDFHDYCQDVSSVAERMKKLEDEDVLIDQVESTPVHCNRQKYRGEAVFASEYGGIKWDIDDTSDSWGYGEGPKTEGEFAERYKGLTETFLNNKKIMGFCYTQLYDVEQEKNGLYTYERKPKFDMNIFREINCRKAAIED